MQNSSPSRNSRGTPTYRNLADTPSALPPLDFLRNQPGQDEKPGTAASPQKKKSGCTPAILAISAIRGQEAVRDALVVTPEETALIRERVAEFKLHLAKPGPVLFLVLPGSENREGFCLTCGEMPIAGRLGVRCRICGEAARLALSKEQVRGK